MGAVEAVDVPVCGFGQNEAVHALAWVPSQPDCLLSGTGFKWLRMYDLRAREATLSFLAHTRAVLGVELDPFVEHRLATFSEDAHGEVKVWDLRSLRDNTPIFSFRAAAPAAPARAPSAPRVQAAPVSARASRSSAGARRNATFSAQHATHNPP